MTTSDRHPTATGHGGGPPGDPAPRRDGDHEYPETGSADRRVRDHDTGRRLDDSAPRDGRTGGDGSNKLFSAARAEEYSSRWTAVKGEFVDEPRRAVAQADQLVGELLDELHESFSRQRHSLDHGLDNDQASTEDLRMALGRYRDFFNRLLSV